MKARFLYLDMPLEKQTPECCSAMYSIFPDGTSIKSSYKMLLLTFSGKQSLASLDTFIVKLETSLGLSVENLNMNAYTQTCTVTLR